MACLTKRSAPRPPRTPPPSPRSNAAYRVGGARAWTTEAHLVTGARVTEIGLVDAIARDGSVMLVAERKVGIVGCVHVARAVDAAAECVLGMLSVDPAEQAVGVGRALVAEAERVVRRTFGARVMSMRVITDRPELLAWYERRGYRRTGIVVPFEAPPAVTLPRGQVYFERLEKRLVE